MLVDSMAQVNEDHKLAAISEPDFDLDAVEVPADGADGLRVRPGSPPRVRHANWKGLSIERPQYEFTGKGRRSQLAADDGEVRPVDAVRRAGRARATTSRAI